LLKSLYGKLALALGVILALLGALFAYATVVSSRAFFAEINQGLHRELADHLVAESLPMSDGQVQEEALEHIFHMLMVVNPSIEVYLLDPQGTVLAYSAPKGAVVRESVDLGPVRTFLDAQSPLPIWGEDPRSHERRRVFSAAPVGPIEQPEGYLYVVLGGEQLDSAVRMVRASQGLRLGLGAVAALVAFALLAGLLLFAFITRRLRQLDHRMQSFRESDFSETPEPVAPRAEGDEIDRLEITFQEMADRLLEQLDELRKTDKLRRELVANVSHDLKTPLTSLRGYLETLRVMDDIEPEERRAYLETALRQTRRLGRLVNELLELARLDSATIEMRREPLALNELVQDVVQQFQLTACESSVELSCKLPPGLAMVDGDVGLISRALENLIDNGLRHTPAGGRVEVRVVTNGSHVGLVVEDSGCGIAAQDLPRVFDRFFRSENGDGGTGLGLAIAKRVVELHDGSIHVQSSEGEGATFELSLPAAAAGS
jgi:signal transduction histidine kinase